MFFQFSGKVALVTGGSSGMGRATAIAYAKEGIKVVVADRNVQGGEETVSLIKANGGEAIFIQCDVSKEDQVENLVKKTMETAVDIGVKLDVDVEVGKTWDLK